MAGLAKIIADLVRVGYPESVAERITSGDLPMDRASRLERARSMGFDTDNMQYHGTRDDFKNFEPSWTGTKGPGVYTSSDPEIASYYAQDGQVMPLFTRGDTITMNDLISRYPNANVNDLDQLVKKIDSRGEAAGISFGANRNTFNPKNIRSVNAAFDPEYKGSNILGGGAAAALGLGALTASEDSEAGVGGEAVPGISKLVTELFDLSNLDRVPDVPQKPLERYDPPRGRPSNLDTLLTDETADRLAGYAAKGEKVGGRSWYNTSPLRDAFIEELGPQVGGQQFDRYMDFVAATSPRSKVDGNIRRASYFRQLDNQGQQFADLSNADLPQGYGHLAHETQNYMLRDLKDGGHFQALNRPKVSSFAENLKGNQAPMTIDTHNMAAVTGNFKNKKSPSDTQYKYLEEFQGDIAAQMNMTPAQFQASVWMGADTGVADARPFMEVFDDVVARTAKRDKKTKKEVLTDFIQGKAPLYSMAGASTIAAGSLIAPQEAQAQDLGMMDPRRVNDGFYAPRSETLQGVTMGLRGLERRLEGSPAQLLFPGAFVDHLEAFNRPYEKSTATGAAMAALDFL